jgi:hypothetical protein
MANGSEPSGVGLVIATGIAIATVVGLYANDAIPRRSGPSSQFAISWPTWQSSPSYDSPTPQPVQGAAAPTQPQEPTGPRYQRQPDQAGAYEQSQQQNNSQQQQGYPPPQQGYPQQNNAQQNYPQQQGYPPPQQQGYPQQGTPPDNDPRDVPDENGAPTQQQYQQPQYQQPPNGQRY